jgi:hypothetical protein
MFELEAIMSRFIQNITIENRQVDRENLFAIGYCPEIAKHLLCVHISWIAGYDRYYELDEGDRALFEINRETFLKKYEKEIKAHLTERMIGAGALRDYDFRCLPDDILERLDKYPPFGGYVYQDGLLCARIKIEDKYFNLPPIYDKKYR